MMKTLKVTIEVLSPLRVARTTYVGELPESEVESTAIMRLLQWAEGHGQTARPYRFFGYDNCQPYPNHRYTTLITVGNAAVGDETVEIVDLPGGMYAVAEVTGVEAIHATWQALVNWCGAQGHALAEGIGLEEMLDPRAEPQVAQLRLWLPVVG